MKAQTPHQRIMTAARKGKGLRLSAAEVRRLSLDDAISTCAAEDDDYESSPELYMTWQRYEHAITLEEKEAARQELVRLGELKP